MCAYVSVSVSVIVCVSEKIGQIEHAHTHAHRVANSKCVTPYRGGEWFPGFYS